MKIIAQCCPVRSRIGVRLTGILGILAFTVSAQSPEIVQTNVVNATAPLFSNGTMSARVDGGVAPYNFTLTNVSLNQNVQSGQLGGNKSGFNRIGNYSTSTYYRSTGTYGSFNDAASTASTHGGYLLSINSSAEMSWLISNGGWQTGDHFGATDQNNEGSWTWSSGESFSYSNWSPGEPNNGGGNQDYSQLYANGTWDDIGWNQDNGRNVLMEIPNQLNFSGLYPGTYQLEVRDNTGENAVYEFTLGPTLEIQASTATDSECSGGSNGRIVAVVTGGAPPYTYEWSTGDAGTLPQELDGFTMLGEFGEKVYYLSNGGFANYAAASAEGDRYLGYIASINSATENNWLVSTGGWSHGVYVGGSDQISEGTWLWDSGEPFSYTNWNPGEPNNVGNEDYMQLYSTGKWNDIPWSTSSRVLFELAYFTSVENLTAGTYTLTITDSQGVEVTETFIVGQPSPVVATFTTTPSSNCGANNNGTISTEVTGGTAPYSYAWSNGSTSSGPEGVTSGTYSVTITDARNCQTSFNAVVDAVDIDAPAFLLQNLTVSLDANGTVSIDAIDAVAQMADDCDDSPEIRISLSEVIAQQGLDADEYGTTALDFTCENIGDHAVFVTAVDADGNASVQSFTLTVRDVLAPTALANNGTIYLDETGNATATDSFIEALDNGSFDNCGLNGSRELNRNVFDCEDLGDINLTYSITDMHGNVGSVAITMSVIDTIKPIVNVHSPTIYLNENGMASLSPSQVDNNCTDNCGIESRTLDKTAFNCEDLGQQYITFTVADGSGNSRSEQVLVTILDQIAPVVEVRNFEIALTEEEASLYIEDIELSASDNCGITERMLSQKTFTCAHLGENEVVYTVTDQSGNVTEHVVIITVIDAVSPIASPTSIVAELDADGNVVISDDTVSALIGAESSDNCASTLMHEISQVEFDCDMLGPNTVSYTVTDLANNSSSADVTITVVDNVAPTAMVHSVTVVLDESGAGTLTPEDVNNNSFDNCGIETMSLTKTTFDCNDLGEKVVGLNVVDQSGNSDVAYFVAYIVDEAMPTAEVTQKTIYLDEDGWAQVNTNDIVLGTDDNCGVQDVALSKTHFNCSDAGSNQVMVHVTDHAGNEAQIPTTITVIDEMAPTLSIESMQLPLNEVGTASLTGGMLMEFAHDNCGVAQITVGTSDFDCTAVGSSQTTEVEVTDVHGNVTTTTINVVITDDQGPTVTAEDVVLELDETGVAVLTEEVAQASAIDNCSVLETAFSQTVYTCDDLNSATITSFSAADGSGNISQTYLTVSVVDNIAPVIEAPEVITVCSNEPIMYESVQAFDNCNAELIQLEGPANLELLNAGSYTSVFQAIDGSGNTTSRTVQIEVLQAPVVDLGENLLVEDGDVVTLDAGYGEGYTYEWSQGGDTQTIDIKGGGTQTYSVTVTAPNGCQSAESILITNNPSLGIDDEELNNAIVVYPNPTSGELAVNFNLATSISEVQLNVTDITGRIVKQLQLSKVVNGEQVTLDLRDLADGSYIVNVRSAGVNLSQNIVKQD